MARWQCYECDEIFDANEVNRFGGCPACGADDDEIFEEDEKGFEDVED